ncbi:MAG: helix-turn-helix domain-containing protein [Egibacteraceae bacterium]
MVIVGRWDAQLVRALREALRMSQEQLAQHLEVADRTIRAWESGAKISFDSQQLLDVALARADSDTKTRFALVTVGNSMVVSDLAPNGSEDPTNRNQALKTMLAGLAGLGPLDVAERIAHVLGGSARVDDRLLDGLHARTGRLGGAWDGLGPAVVLGPAMRHLDTLERLHSHSMTELRRRRLHAVSADAAALLGYLSHHMDRDADAVDFYTLAQRFARDAGDRALQAQVLGLKSWACSTFPSGGQRGDPKAALELLDQADALASQAPPLLRARLAVRRSAEHALAREVTGWRAFEIATRAVEDGDLTEPSGGFLGGRLAPGRVASSVAAVEGLCHTLFNQPRKAEIALIRTLRAADPSDVSHVALLLGDLAAAYVLQREPEQACRSACAGLDVADPTGLTLAVQRVRGVRAQFPEPWTPLACVRELDDRLHVTA